MANPSRKALLRKIAKMELMGVPRQQIGDSISRSESFISQIVTGDAEYAQIAQQLSAEEFDKLDTLNSGWDSVESLAITQVITHLQQVPDPEFAVRAAAMANKAQRRGLFNKPITPADGQHVARISLNATFVDKLQQVTINQEAGVDRHASATPNPNTHTHANPSGNNSNGAAQRYGFKPVESIDSEADRPALEHLAKKDTNFLNPSAVHKLLDPEDSGTRSQSSLANMLEDYGIADAIPQFG